MRVGRTNGTETLLFGLNSNKDEGVVHVTCFIRPL